MTQVQDNEKRPPSLPPILMGSRQIVAMGIYFLVLALLTVYLLASLWPERINQDTERVIWDPTATVFGFHFSLQAETRLILLVIVAGALGSYVHAATSFATYAGNRTLVTSWFWWYILRTPIGVVLALLFYFVTRGGLLSAGATGQVLSPFGVAAIAGLAGMFSKQATDKLRELFDNLFRTAPGEGDAQRIDKPQESPVNPVPKLTAIQPTSLPKGSAEAALEVIGNNFVKTSTVQVNGSERPTKHVSATQLTAQLTAIDLGTEGALRVTVVNPAPGGGVSEAAILTVA